MKTSSKKKGKYKPLSYFIEKDLIIYNSLNQIKKLVAFGILQIRDVSNLIQILNNFIKRSCLDSYTIQIGVNSGTYIILQFASEEKKDIVQDYFKLCELLDKTEIQYSLLENNLLEMEFLTILCKGGSSTLNEMKISISNAKKGLSITNDKTTLNYIFYNIKLDLLTDEIYFFQHIIKYLEEREIKGYLFVHNTLDKVGDLRGSAYLVVILKEENSMIDLIKISREFFKRELLVLQKPKINLIWQCLWRIPMSHNLTRIDDRFILDPRNIPSTINEILTQLEKKLSENNIKYEIVKDFQVLINQNWLFSIFSNLNLNKLSEIIKDHINKYHIYILVINHPDYSKLVSYNNITKIDNLTILSIEDFLDLDYGVFE